MVTPTGRAMTKPAPLAGAHPPAECGMSSTTNDRELTQTLPSSLESYHGFVQKILDQLSEMGWRQSDLFAVHMALEESISNAIRHGNRLDATKHVEIKCQLSPTRFWAHICDEGPGFRPADVPDCCSPECIELPGGRGLALMNAYMTRVEYNQSGNCVTLEKQLAGHSSPNAAAG